MTHLGSPQDTYEILKQIGDGSFGTVHKARHKITRKPVAVKVMKKKFTCLQDCEGQFEPKLLFLLPPHINIVQLYDSFLSTTNDLSFVMEYMDGGNLYQLMRERKHQSLPFNSCELRNILHQILSAVSHIHHHKIFHRDMKPENLLLDYSSGRPIIKLADFGLARELDTQPPYTEYVSTRWYRAPEVLLRSTEYTAPVDLWALGAIFAELITLEPLFPGESEIDQIYRICEILGSPGNKLGVIGQKFMRPEKRASPGFARKKVIHTDTLSTPSTISSLDGGGEWKEGVKLAHKIGFKFPKLSPKPLETVIPNATKSMLDLIQHFLFFNPQQRRSADAALRHPFFSETDEPVHTIVPTNSKPLTPPNKHNSILMDITPLDLLKIPESPCEICPDWDTDFSTSQYGRLCSAIKDRPSTLSLNHDQQEDAYLIESRPIYSSHQKSHPFTQHDVESLDLPQNRHIPSPDLSQQRSIYSSQQKVRPLTPHQDTFNDSQIWYSSQQPLRPRTPVSSFSGRSVTLLNRHSKADHHQAIPWTQPHFIQHPRDIIEKPRPHSRQGKRQSGEYTTYSYEYRNNNNNNNTSKNPPSRRINLWVPEAEEEEEEEDSAKEKEHRWIHVL